MPNYISPQDAEKYRKQLLSFYNRCPYYNKKNITEISSAASDDKNCDNSASSQTITDNSQDSDVSVNSDNIAPSAVAEPSDDLPIISDNASIPPISDDIATPSETVPFNINERFPDPDLSSLDSMNTPSSQNSADFSLYNDIGHLRIFVTTADCALPVEGACVIITAHNSKGISIFASDITDQSGCSAVFALPAPEPMLSLKKGCSVRPYAVYDICVSSDGFFTEKSVDVPVFAGITSVQQFSMKPLPAFMPQNCDTVTYYNNEPTL